MNTNIMPLGARVLVRRAAPVKVSAGGLVIPDAAQEKRPMRGVVVALGDQAYFSRRCHLHVGDTVIFSVYAGIEYTGVLFLNEEEILGVLREDHEEKEPLTPPPPVPEDVIDEEDIPF